MDCRCIIKENYYVDKGLLVLINIESIVGTGIFNQIIKIHVYQITSQKIDTPELAWTTARIVAKIQINNIHIE